MKKHQLLEKAMRDYPKDTTITWGAGNAKVSGIYRFTSKEGFLVIQDDKEFDIYDEGHGSNPWAKIVKPSILSGRVAIQVNNEREFKLLMEHYEAKGWRWINGHPPLPISNSTKGILDIYNYKTTVMYQDNFKYNIAKPEEWKIIPFSDFAAEVGIKIPKFIMKSEDGVDLYEGDDYHGASFLTKWEYLSMNPIQCTGAIKSNPDKHKAFFTKESAEAWIAKANKPAVIRLNFEGGEAIITKDKIRVHLDAENGKGYYMEATEIEPIYEAYKSLQS